MASCLGCGDCDIEILSPDPSGVWIGTLRRVESDCGDESSGESFDFTHTVSLGCDNDGDTVVELSDQSERTYSHTSYSSFGGGSFSSRWSNSDATIDITYDNFDGSLADVTQKIRVYKDGKIQCSEKYAGRGRR